MFDDKNYFKSISSACEKLGGWIKAMRSIYLTNLKLEPIISKQKEAQDKLSKHQETLDKLVVSYKELEDKVKSLQKDEFETKEYKENTQRSLETNKIRLLRANKLLTGLKDEYTRWKKALKSLDEQ